MLKYHQTTTLHLKFTETPPDMLKNIHSICFAPF